MLSTVLGYVRIATLNNSSTNVHFGFDSGMFRFCYISRQYYPRRQLGGDRIQTLRGGDCGSVRLCSVAPEKHPSSIIIQTSNFDHNNLAIASIIDTKHEKKRRTSLTPCLEG